MDLALAKSKLRTALLSRINAVPDEERPALYEATGRLTTLVGIIRALQARASVQDHDLCGAALLDAAESLKVIFYDDVEAFEEALALVTPDALGVVVSPVVPTSVIASAQVPQMTSSHS